MCYRVNAAGGTEVVQVSNCDLDCPPPHQCNPHAFECFVRNVLTRYLAELVLDVGTPTTTGIVASIPEVLLAGLPSVSEFQESESSEAQPGVEPVVPLTDGRRQAIAEGAGARILELAATYQTQVDFKSYVLEGTELGDQVVELYHRYLPSIWEVARSRFDLFERSRELWLRTHPLVAEVVALARADQDAAPAPHAELRYLSSEDVDELTSIGMQFVDNTDDESFRNVVRTGLELAREFVGRSSREILESIRQYDGPMFRQDDTST
jgi:hypothetical protein